MFSQDLNQHFKPLKESLQLVGVALFWNLIIYVLVLGTFTLWNLHSELNFQSPLKISESWVESQLTFATVTQYALLWLFQGYWRWPNFNEFFIGILQGAAFAILFALTLVFSGKLEFLGFASPSGLNFVSNYAWITQSLTIVAFLFGFETFTHQTELKRYSTLQALLLVGIFSIWFEFRFFESISLFFVFVFADWFKQPSGVVSGFLFMIHAILGQSIFGIEFLGLVQCKFKHFEGTFLEYPWVWGGLAFFSFIFRGLPFFLPFLQSQLKFTAKK